MVHQTMDFVSKKWALLILTELYKGDSDVKRFSELLARVPGITPKLLTTRLKDLEAGGLISKRLEVGVFPKKSHYALTESGMDFMQVIASLKDWALKWRKPTEWCIETNCKNCVL